MTEDRDIQQLLTRARRAAPDDEALDRVWRRLQAPPPIDPGDGPEIDVPDVPAMDPVTSTTLGKTLLMGAIKAVTVAAAVAGIIGVVAAVTRGPASEPSRPAARPRR